jgi:hypothetical protein
VKVFDIRCAVPHCCSTFAVVKYHVIMCSSICMYVHVIMFIQYGRVGQDISFTLCGVNFTLLD